MTDFIIYGIIWTLALYGAIEIIRTIITCTLHTKTSADGVFLIIAVKNEEEKAEGILRSILYKIFYGKEDSIKNVFITDLNSTDSTKDILERLEKDYNFVQIMSWEECRKKLEKAYDQDTL